MPVDYISKPEIHPDLLISSDHQHSQGARSSGTVLHLQPNQHRQSLTTLLEHHIESQNIRPARVLEEEVAMALVEQRAAVVAQHITIESHEVPT